MACKLQSLYTPLDTDAENLNTRGGERMYIKVHNMSDLSKSIPLRDIKEGKFFVFVHQYRESTLRQVIKNNTTKIVYQTYSDGEVLTKDTHGDDTSNCYLVDSIDINFSIAEKR
jgi:hypothetical protein